MLPLQTLWSACGGATRRVTFKPTTAVRRAGPTFLPFLPRQQRRRTCRARPRVSSPAPLCAGRWGVVFAMAAGGGMTAAERASVQRLVEFTSAEFTKDTADTLLLVLRQCNHDVEAAAGQLLDSAWRGWTSAACEQPCRKCALP